MYYFEEESKSIAVGNVHVFDVMNAVNIYGDSLIHIEQRKFTLVLKQPRLVKIDTSTSGTIDTMVRTTLLASYSPPCRRPGVRRPVVAVCIGTERVSGIT